MIQGLVHLLRRLSPFEKVVFFVCILASVVGLWDILLRLWFEAQGSLDGDADIYFALGRGILNGLTPYRDLFENKPPGIFLLTAASLVTTGGPLLAKLFEILALLSPLYALLWWIKHFPTLQWKITFSVFLFGCILLLFAAQNGGEVQVESFGVAFAAWYPALLSVRSSRWCRRDTLVAMLLCLGSVGFKEPFLLPFFACGLLLTSTVTDFGRRCLLPFLMAVFVGGLLLSLLGWLHPYLSVYLHFMLTEHIVRTGPVWVRGFELFGILRQSLHFSPFLPFVLVTILAVAGFALWQRSPATRWWNLWRFTLALYLLVLSVGIGGYYYAHHYLFPVAGFIACFLLSMEWVHRTHANRALGAGFALLLAMTVLFHHRVDYALRLQEWHQEIALKQKVAVAVDAVMNACGVDRYLHLVNKGSGPYGWTHHSPAGPVFLLYTRFAITGNSVAQHFREDRLILMRDTQAAGLTEQATQYLSVHFAEQPWPCAGKVPSLDPYHLLFRREIDLDTEDQALIQRNAPLH